MTEILQEIIAILYAGITGVAEGLGAGLSSLVQHVFLDVSGDTTKLSVFGGLVVVFAGISLAVGLSKWVVRFVTSLGASH